MADGRHLKNRKTARYRKFDRSEQNLTIRRTFMTEEELEQFQ